MNKRLFEPQFNLRFGNQWKHWNDEMRNARISFFRFDFSYYKKTASLSVNFVFLGLTATFGIFLIREEQQKNELSRNAYNTSSRLHSQFKR